MLIGAEKDESTENRIKRTTFMLLILITGTAAIGWASIYIFLKLYLAASIPLFYSAASLLNLLYTHKTKNIAVLRNIQTLLILITPFAIMWLLGGLAQGSFVFIWAFFAPISVLTYAKKSTATIWFAAFICLVIISVVIDPILISKDLNTMSQITIEIFYMLNLVAGLTGTYLLIRYFIHQSEQSNNNKLKIEQKSKKDLETAHSQLKHIAGHDALTGLNNRYLLKVLLSKHILHAKADDERLALIFLGLDKFKDTNDKFGQAIGDEILVEVSNRIKHLSPKRSVTARMGGDEFAIIIPGPFSIESIKNIITKTIKEISQPYSFAASYSSISASLGVSIYPEHGSTQEQLFHNTDIALYYAKKKGEGSYRFFDEGLNERNSEINKIKEDLMMAVKNNEFEMYYQPQIHSTTTVIGCEALIRWNKPDKGLISPVDFIEIAEQSGIILDIGNWVIEDVCRNIRTTIDSGYKAIKTAINVSAIQLNDESLVDHFKKNLDKYNIDAQLIELEITESSIMEDIDRSISLLNELKSLGMKISLDDFGTGHSSLSYLKNIPTDKLKIDRAFIKDLSYEKDSAIITKTIIDLARGLNIEVLAEGVETKEQVDILLKYNYDIVQGYYYSKPLKVQDFNEFVKLHS